MKIILLFWLCALNALAVQIEWDAVTNRVDNSPATNLAYRVYVGQVSRSYVTSYTTTNTLLTITNSTLTVGTNYFAITTFDTDGLESEFSKEVFWVKTNTPPRAPLNLRISGTNDVGTIKLLQSNDLTGGGQWTETGQAFVPVTNGPTTFFKAVAPAPAKQFVSASPVKAGKLITRQPARPFKLPPLPR